MRRCRGTFRKYTRFASQRVSPRPRAPRGPSWVPFNPGPTLTSAHHALPALGLAFARLKLAFEKNLGGFGDLMRRSWERTALFFSAIKQLFEDGGFSGAMREELNRTENLGLKDFLINLFLWGHQIVHFLKGISTGFAAGVENARPAMEAFVGALTRLGQALGLLSARDDATTAAAKFRAFVSSVFPGRRFW